MKNQWTTVHENENTASKTSANMSDAKMEKRNKKVALAMASIGVFFILIGAAPFLFGNGDNSNYSAFIARNTINSTDSGIVAEATPTDINFKDGDEFISEPVNTVSQKADITMPAIPAIPGMENGSTTSEATTSEPTTIEETTPTVVTTPTPTPIAEIETATAPVAIDITQEEFSKPAIISNLGASDTLEGTFPLNKHTGGSADPVAFEGTVTLTTPAFSESTHSAATPDIKRSNPSTGLPVLPLLAFSGAAAFYGRMRKHRK